MLSFAYTLCFYTDQRLARHTKILRDRNNSMLVASRGGGGGAGAEASAGTVKASSTPLAGNTSSSEQE